MILRESSNSEFLSNAYLVCDEPGGKGVLFDSNAVTDPLARAGRARGHRVTHIAPHPPSLRPRRRRSQDVAERVGAPARARPRAGRGPDRRTDRRDVRRGLHVRVGRPEHARSSTRPATAPTTCAVLDQRHRRAHRRRPLQGHRRRHARSGRHRVRGPQAARSWTAHEAAARDADPPGPPRADDGRRGVGVRTRSSGSGAASTRRAPSPCRGRRRRRARGDDGPLGARLRRRQQGLGALPLRRGRDRGGIPVVNGEGLWSSEAAK